MRILIPFLGCLITNLVKTQVCSRRPGERSSLVGIIGNGMMVLCFFRDSKFNSSCHVFITLTCLVDIFHIGGEFIFTVQIFGNFTTPQYICFYMMIIPIIGATAGSPLILAMGIDRLIAVKFPISYRPIQADKTCYILVHMIFPVVYTFGVVVLGFRARILEDSFQVQCPLPVALYDFPYKFLSFANALINGLVIIIYTTVYILLKRNPASARSKTVFHSLIVTVFFILAGWGVTASMNIFNYLLVKDPFIYEFIQLYSGIPIIFSLTSTVFVFYAVNPEYRKALNSQLSAIGIRIQKRPNSSWTQTKAVSSVI